MRVLAGIAVTTSLALGAGGLAAVAAVGDGPAPAPAATTTTIAPPTPEAAMVVETTTVAPTTTTSTTTTTTTLPTPTTAAAPPTTFQVSMPEPPPEDPREKVPVVAIGRIRIPAIGLDHEVYEGVSLTVIDVGPGHWPGTPTPGGAGNVVFGGHRVTNSHPFRDLDLLKPGDEISFEMYDGTRAYYAVTEQFIVNPDAMWIVDPTPTPMLTLFACHPKGSARQRIVVRAEYKPT